MRKSKHIPEQLPCVYTSVSLVCVSITDRHPWSPRFCPFSGQEEDLIEDFKGITACLQTTLFWTLSIQVIIRRRCPVGLRYTTCGVQDVSKEKTSTNVIILVMMSVLWISVCITGDYCVHLIKKQSILVFRGRCDGVSF